MVRLTDLGSDFNQKDWKRACEKLGLVVKTKFGHGSHIRVFHPDGNKATPPITIQYHITKAVSKSIYKKLLVWGFTEEQIDRALK